MKITQMKELYRTMRHVWMNKEFDLKQIAKKIEEYRKIVNKHARKIFMNLKDGKYP